VFVTPDGRRLIGIGQAETAEGITDCGFGVWDWESDQGKANAHLIAAAPDLYEACDEALAFMELTSVTGSLPDQLRAALNKARGLNGGGDE
jgi:hypothetical protein